ncbi:MAG: glycosyl hydrolase [Ferruginibacter sp.]
MKKISFILFTAIICLTASGQIKWPVITQQNKPWTRWWWLGSQVNKKDLTTLMQQYRQVGLGGLEITPIYGVQGEQDQYINFLSPKWMEVFDHTLTEGKRLNLGIDLANATGWPFGGPWIGDEDACKNMVYKTYSLSAGQSLTETVEFIQEPLVRTENYKSLKIEDIVEPVAANKNLQGLSIDQVKFKRRLPLQLLMGYTGNGKNIDLTNKVDAAGKLHWTAPAGGKWTLYALFMGWHGKQVERAAPGGEGNVIDHFSATALQHYLARFDSAFKRREISSLRAFFNDSYEVDDARGQSNYTPLLFQEFKRRRGYELKTELPALFTKNPTERTNRILCDYRMTIDELILEKFTGEWYKWAHKKGKIVRNQSHGSPANTLDLYGVVDIPETEGTEILRIKFAPSTAHVMGKQLASAEAATWLNEHFVSSLSDVKKALDVYFIGGINHIVYHGTTYLPPSEPWPGRLFYAAVEFTQTNPFWDNFSALNKYVARTQSFLQQGKADNDVLLYFPIYDKYSEPGKDLLLHFDGMKPDFNGTPFEIAAQMMQENGYAFDYISDRQILQLQTRNKKIITGGTAYQTIVLPDCKFIKAETMQKIFSLAKSGAMIIAYKNLPADVPGYAQLDQHSAMLRKLLSQLKFSSNSFDDVKSASIGKGMFLIGNELQQLLAAARIRKEDMVEKGLAFNRRKNANGTNFYFIANRSNKKIEEWIPMAVKANSAALFNPMNAESGIGKLRKDSAGYTEVFMQLEPDESYIVQTSTNTLTGTSYPYTKLIGEPIQIAGEWKLQFLDGGPSLPASSTASELTLWTEMDGEIFKTFSGTAAYSAHFKKPISPGVKQYLLDLGKVYESARVFLNGNDLGSLIGPVFTIKIDAKELKPVNLLEIKVSNSMANRIIDLDKRKVVWKKFNNTNFPARLAQNRGADGLFDASKWQPRVSGLAGPVTLTPIE